MKKNLFVILFSFALVVACSAYGPSGEPGPGYPPAGGYGDISIGFFYDYLSPFGTWVEFSPYGYVWRPHYLGAGWRPYSYGQWLWTDYGWTWLSDYDWGWVPFHYGRWDWDDGLGWFWVPDTIWGPAWVTWDWDDAYIGWAPLPPWVEFSAGMGIYGFNRPLRDRDWCFVESSRFLEPRLRNYVMPFERNATIVKRSLRRTDITMVNNRIFNGGAGIDEVRRLTRREVPRYRLEDAVEPGRQRVESGVVRMYRPPVQRIESARPKSFVLRDEAPQRLKEIRGKMSEESGQPAQSAKSLLEDHKNEKKLLDKSQKAERDELARKQKEGTKGAVNEAERERINQEAKVKQQEVEKKHADEKAQMMRRHSEDEHTAGVQRQGSGPKTQPKKKG
jgi:hypothetical protein